jgi:hypothetical protein
VGFFLANLPFVSLIHSPQIAEPEWIKEKVFHSVSFSGNCPICFGVRTEISTQQYEHTEV